VLREHRRWLDRAGEWLEEGSAYAGALAGWRLRAASALPAILARGTLDLLREAGPEVLRKRVKLPRRDVYAAVLRAFLFKHP
jgi:phytoene/squalene synthetase